MSAKPKATASDVVAVTGKRKLVEKRQLLWGGIAAAIIVLGVAAYVAFRPYHAPAPPKKSSSPASGTKAQALQNSINQLNAKGDFAQAAKAAEQNASKDTDSQLVLAAAYSNNKQYDKAMAVYDSLISAGKLTGDNMVVAGEVAVQAGDKKRAIGYFEKAIDTLQQENGPFSKRQIAYANREISEMKQ